MKGDYGKSILSIVYEVSWLWKLSLIFFLRLAAQGAALWLDTSSVNAAIVNAYGAACDRYYRNRKNKQKTKTNGFDGYIEKSDLPFAVHKVSPVSISKAIKNEVELEGMQNCHLR